MNTRRQFKRANDRPGKGQTGASRIVPPAAAPAHYHGSGN